MKYPFKCDLCNVEFFKEAPMKSFNPKEDIYCPNCGGISHRIFRASHLGLSVGDTSSSDIFTGADFATSALRHSHPSDHFKNGSKEERGKVYL